MKVEYPDIPFLFNSPWKPQSGFFQDPDFLLDKPVVVTEKMDGKSVTLTKHDYYGRGDQALTVQVPSLWHQYSSAIPEAWRLTGEDMFEVQTINYGGLRSNFFVHTLVAKDRVLSWSETEQFCTALGLPLTRVLYRGILGSWDASEAWAGESRSKAWVIRHAGSFWFNNFMDVFGQYESGLTKS